MINADFQWMSDGNGDIDMLQHINMRGIECTVRYNFNATKSKYTGRGADAEEK
jgi:hypothetical protein